MGIPSRVRNYRSEQHLHGGQLAVGVRPLDCNDYETIVVLIYIISKKADSHCTDYRGDGGGEGGGGGGEDGRGGGYGSKMG